MVLTSAKAMSASSSRFSSSSRVIDAKLSPTILSVSGAIADALDHVGEARIVRQVRLAQHFRAQLLPLALALDRNQDVLAVLRAEHAVGRDRGMREAHALRRIAGLGIQQRHGEPVGHHVEHRDADVGALAGDVPRPISASRIAACAVAPVAISTMDRPTRDGAFRAAGDRGQTAFGLDQQVIGLAVGIGAVVAIAGDGAADQRWIILAQPFAAKSRACPSSRA